MLWRCFHRFSLAFPVVLREFGSGDFCLFVLVLQRFVCSNMSSPSGSGAGSGQGSGSSGKRGRRAKRASSSATRQQQQQPATDPGAHGELLSLLHKSTSASSILRVRVPSVCPGG